MRVSELAERISRHDPVLAKHEGWLILDGGDKLAGILTRSDLLKALEQDPTGAGDILQAGTRNPVVAYPDELLYNAAAKMLRNGVGRLPVVDPANPGKVIGYLGRAGILAARLRKLEEEHVREPGMFRRRVVEQK
jgi:CBS domain-containing protein